MTVSITLANPSILAVQKRFTPILPGQTSPRFPGNVLIRVNARRSLITFANNCPFITSRNDVNILGVWHIYLH